MVLLKPGTGIRDSTSCVDYPWEGTAQPVAIDKALCKPETIAPHIPQGTLSTGSRSHLVHVLYCDIPFVLNIIEMIRI